MLPIPIRTDNRLSRRPWVNYALIAANVLIFLFFYRGEGPGSLAYGRAGRFFLDPDYPRMEQFFGSLFLHGGWGHLIGNMLFLYVFGNAVNDRFGHVGYIAFYLAGGVVAGVGYILLGAQNPALGASGAIAAVTGCYLVLFPRVRVTCIWWFWVIIPLEVSSLYVIGAYFVYDALMTVTRTGGGVAYSAHMCGSLYGMTLAAGLLVAGLLPRDVYDLPSLIRTWRRRQSYRRMTSRGYDPFSYHSVGRAAGGRENRWVRATAVESTPRTDTATARALQLRQEVSAAHGLGDFSAAAAKYLELVNADDDVVLPRQMQLDVANQLMTEQRYAQAADAYERLLRHYPSYEHLADIELMLGIIYGRYLKQNELAGQHLRAALSGLHESRKIQMAKAELDALGGGQG